MDHTAPREGPNDVGVYKYFRCLTHQSGYQRIRETSGPKISGDFHMYIEIDLDFLDISSLGATYRYVVKSSRNLGSRTNESSSLEICNSQSMVRVALTPRPKDRVSMSNPRITIPIHQQRRVMGSQRRTLENCVISTKSIGKILMNVTQNIRCWMR
jgi:hypothetical protein